MGWSTLKLHFGWRRVLNGWQRTHTMLFHLCNSLTSLDAFFVFLFTFKHLFYYATALHKSSPKLHVTPGLFHRPQESSLVSIIQTASEILFPPLSFWLIGKEVAISRCRAVPITISPPDSVPRALIPLGPGSLFWRFCFIWSLLSEKVSSEKIENFKQYLKFFSGQWGLNKGFKWKWVAKTFPTGHFFFSSGSPRIGGSTIEIYFKIKYFWCSYLILLR